MGLKKGARKSTTARSKSGAAARWGPNLDKENISPLQQKLEQAEERVKRQNTELTKYKREHERLRKDLKNSAARDKRHYNAQQSWKKRELEMGIHAREAESAALLRQSFGTQMQSSRPP